MNTITKQDITVMLDKLSWQHVESELMVKTFYSGMRTYRNEDFEPVVKIFLAPLSDTNGVKLIVADLFEEFADLFDSDGTEHIFSQILIDTEFTASIMCDLVHLNCVVNIQEGDCLEKVFSKAFNRAFHLVDQLYEMFCAQISQEHAVH